MKFNACSIEYINDFNCVTSKCVSPSHHALHRAG